MKAWFQRFMSGRYGYDQLGRFLCFFAMACLLLGLFANGLLNGVLYWVGLAVLVWAYFRMFSRNTRKRYAENQKYLQLMRPVNARFAKWKLRFDQRKVYRYYRCPHCRQELRVPRGRGRISISCPKCGTTFIKKS